MPELAEVEVITRQFRKNLLGAVSKKMKFYRSDLRQEIPTRLCQSISKDQTILVSVRRGKYMIVGTGKGFLYFHFGMSGRLVALPYEKPSFPHTHLVWTLEQTGEERYLHYIDPRRFGAILALPGDDWAAHPCLQDLGPEPLVFKGLSDHLFAASRGKKTPVKSLIMDARVVVGVGNIYACESLLRAKIHPLRPSASLDKAECLKLSHEIKATLKEAISQGGTTLKDFAGMEGGKGYFKVALKAYGRSDCGVCAASLVQFRLSGRSTWSCPSCQGNG